MSEPTIEYWQAKAELCRQTAEDQLMELDTKNAMRNIQRMVYALSKVEGIVTNERDGETICTFCMDNSKSCSACDDSYEGK